MAEAVAAIVDGDLRISEPCSGLADVLDGLADLRNHDIARLSEAEDWLQVEPNVSDGNGR